MSARLQKFLSERTILYVTTLFMVTGLVMFIFVQSSVTTFKTESIRKNMNWMGHSISYFCSSGFDQLARVGAGNDDIQVLLKQAEILEMIEDFSRNNDFKVEVYEVADVSSLLLLSSFSNRGAAVNDPLKLPLHEIVELRADGQVYNGFVVPFEGWKWRVILLRDARSYDSLLVKLRGFYLVMGVLVLMLTFVIIFFLRYSRESSKELQLSQEKLQDTLDSLAEGVIVVNHKGLVSQINPSAESILGVKGRPDLSSRHIADLLTLKTVEDNVILARGAFEEGGCFFEGGDDGEFLLINARNEEKLVQLRFTRTSSASEKRKGALVLSFNDITHNRQIEKKLQQAQKMEVVGLMAGGVAHDLNNILSGIVSYPELILLKLDENSELRNSVEAIKQSGQRAAAVVADLLTVARGVASTREICSANNLISEYVDSPECLKLQEQYPEISLQLELDTGLDNISCSPVHVKKCLLNLIYNGFEAIERAGVCTIMTRKSLVGEQQAAQLQIVPGNYVIIAVADDGPGIDEEDVGQIFEPFFTKKEMGRSGTGLGLSVVWNTMVDHGGTAAVSSGSKGTIFELYFPGVKKQPDEDKEEESHVSYQGNREKVLVVDDDPMQRAIAVDFLTELNYAAASAASGEEALERVSRENFSVIILDMIMEPGINGRMTYERILRIHPQQKALIVSGFSESEEVKMTMELGAGGFMIKPYSLVELGRSLKEIAAG